MNLTDLTPSEIVLILNTLGQLPHNQVHALIDKLMKQVQAQNTDNQIQFPNG